MQKFLTLLILFFCLNIKAQLCFNTAVNYSSGGNNPSALFNADFNADGKLDLAIANQGSNDVSILLGTGTGTFGTASNFAVGASPYSVASADFNGDGKLDLVVANSGSNNVSIIVGSGTGSFGVASNFAVGSIPYSVSVADFNGDGNMDIATANAASNNVSVLLGTGTGSFASAINYNAGTGPQFITNADFNRDGIVDLAVANNGSNNVSILIGTGSGTFGVATNFTVGTAPYAIASNDFNRDGIKDLVVVNYSSNDVSVLLGTGTGSFGVATNFATGFHPVSVASADFDADGKVDLAVVNNGTNNVSVLLGDGTGSMATATDFATGTGSISITTSDFNEDGKIDLAVLNATSANVSVLTNCTTFCDYTFGAATTFSASANNSLVKEDFNKDGILDLAVVGSSNVFVSLGNGNGTFNSPTNFIVGTNATWLVSADFNSDGNVDLATANEGSGNVSILLGTGTGSFATAVNYATGNTPRSITKADFNNDGIIDLAVANNTSNDISVLLGLGNGTFGTANNFSVSGSPMSITSADFNQDGIVDLAITLYKNSNNIAILLGTGVGSFGAELNFTSTYPPASIITADFNLDGKADLASIGFNSSYVSILLGTGTGSFSLSNDFGLGNAAISITCDDFNSDGKPDLAFGMNFISRILFGTGTGSFNAGSIIASNSNYYSVVGGDFNRDGKIDLAIVDYAAVISIYLFNAPKAPTGQSQQSFCYNSSHTVADLVAVGTGIQWYAASTGGVALAPSTVVNNNTSYFASQTDNNCGGESASRFAVMVTLNNTPIAPTASASQLFCSGISPTVNELTATGTSIQWYATSSGGSPLATSVALADNTHYHASQTVNGCESTSRVDVTATINTSPAVPTGTATQVFCSGISPIVDSLIASGTAIKWYAASTGGAPLATSTALADNTHYYATQTVNACESATRLDVTATVNTTPNAPSGTASQLFCTADAPILTDLIATGTSIQWYSTPSGGSPFLSGVTLTDNTHYYATQTLNNCESISRLDVTATINTTPAVPTGTATQLFCSASTPSIADLIVTGTGIQWYTDSIAGTVLPTNTTLIDSIHYYASQLVNSCESATRLDILAIVNTTPTVVSIATDIILCAGDSVVLSGGGATTYVWSGSVSDGVSFAPLATDTYTVTGTASNSCSDTATITISVNSLPVVTASATDLSFCKGDSTVLNAMGALSYVWSDGVTNGIAFAPIATTTYTVTGTDANACNAQASVTVNVIQLPDVTTSVSSGTITANQAGAAYQWINCDNENAPLFGQFNRTFTATANGSYAVVVVKNGCTDTSVCIDFTNVGIVEKNDIVSHFTIYPNPFTSQTTIDFEEEQTQTIVKIVDILGKEIKVIDFTGKQLIIEREDMQAGVYFVHIMSKNKHLTNRKIVIQ
jgi:hypothetical protein